MYIFLYLLAQCRTDLNRCMDSMGSAANDFNSANVAIKCKYVGREQHI